MKLNKKNKTKSEILISSAIAVKTYDSKFYYAKHVKIKKNLKMAKPIQIIMIMTYLNKVLEVSIHQY